jgi:hypothetical protein
VKYEIAAVHPAFGEVTFAISAGDEKRAFSVWKQIVCNPRQWIVRSNVPAGGMQPVAKSDIPELDAFPDL